MKIFLALAALVLLLSPARAESVQQTFSAGQRAFAAGDLAKAREKFEQVLAVKPEHQPSLKYLGMIAARDKSNDPVAVQKNNLSAIVFPVINFNEADLESVLVFLKQEGEKLAGNDTKINFVTQAPVDGAKGKSITLSLTNIPFPEVLRYVSQLAGVTFTIEQYAIRVTPNAPAEKTTE